MPTDKQQSAAQPKSPALGWGLFCLPIEGTC